MWFSRAPIVLLDFLFFSVRKNIWICSTPLIDRGHIICYCYFTLLPVKIWIFVKSLTWLCVGPVSYTHLDVYKRQFQVSYGQGTWYDHSWPLANTMVSAGKTVTARKVGEI